MVKVSLKIVRLSDGLRWSQKGIWRFQIEEEGTGSPFLPAWISVRLGSRVLQSTTHRMFARNGKVSSLELHRELHTLIVVLQRQNRLTNQFLLIPHFTGSLHQKPKAWTSSESFMSDNDQVDRTRASATQILL